MFSLRLFGNALVLVLYAQQSLARPTLRRNAANANTSTNHSNDALSKIQAGYFPNWAIYDENFQPTDIVPSILTNILYAFADVSPTTGAISLTDPYADEQKRFPGDSSENTGKNLYGCLKQLYLLKLANRNLKATLSVGGSTYSQQGHFNFITNANSRATFVSSAVQLVEDYGFDGIDLDFEFPSNTAQGQSFADLITSLRTAFDQLAAKKGDIVPYQITAAVSAGSENYAHLVVKQMDDALSYWNLMAYDYAGEWSTWSDNQANLYGGERTGVNTDQAIKWYISHGATANKINLGIPLYGRVFENTAGLGKSFNGVNSKTEDDGIYPYTDLLLPGAQVHEDTSDVASYSYDSSTKELVSYDTPEIVKLKAQYVNATHLAGSMFWDISTDKVGGLSLVNASASVYGSLDQTQNHVDFPDSKWENVRNNMGIVPSTSPSLDSSQTNSACSVPAWGSSTVYLGDDKASLDGHIWTAKWWTIGDSPGGSAEIWTDDGPC